MLMYLWNGILVGLALAILVGPILFSLVQRSIEQGVYAGFCVGLGIWFSDLFFIVSIIAGMAHVNRLIESPLFKPVLGILGGFVLIAIGVGMFVSKPSGSFEMSGLRIISSKWKLWLEGFLINTINPFTVVFWTSVITSWGIEESLFSKNSYVFFSGILGTIVFTDTLKILLAKKVRHYLKPVQVFRMRKISGLALFVFGVVMMIRVLFF